MKERLCSLLKCHAAGLSCHSQKTKQKNSTHTQALDPFCQHPQLPKVAAAVRAKQRKTKANGRSCFPFLSPVPRKNKPLSQEDGMCLCFMLHRGMKEGPSKWAGWVRIRSQSVKWCVWGGLSSLPPLHLEIGRGWKAALFLDLQSPASPATWVRLAPCCSELPKSPGTHGNPMKDPHLQNAPSSMAPLSSCKRKAVASFRESVRFVLGLPLFLAGCHSPKKFFTFDSPLVLLECIYALFF